MIGGRPQARLALVGDKIGQIYGSGPTQVIGLDQLSITISPGEMVGISGRSGSGKSTLLNLLGLADQPSSGELLIGVELVDL